MNDQEAVQMMKRASGEIKSLRAQIATLAPKADAYDSLRAIIGLLPQRLQVRRWKCIGWPWISSG